MYMCVCMHARTYTSCCFFLRALNNTGSRGRKSDEKESLFHFRKVLSPRSPTHLWVRQRTLPSLSGPQVRSKPSLPKPRGWHQPLMGY